MSDLLRTHIQTKIPLTDDEFTRTERLFTRKELNRRHFLHRQGELCRYESFVESGCLKSYHTDEQGVEHVLRFSVEGWWAGDLDSFRNQTPSSFSIQALEPTTLLVIDPPTLQELYRLVPKMESFFRLLNENALIATSQRMIKNLSIPAKDRYEQFLTTYPHLARRLPLKDIASYLGITPVFLSRLRRQRTGR